MHTKVASVPCDEASDDCLPKYDDDGGHDDEQQRSKGANVAQSPRCVSRIMQAASMHVALCSSGPLLPWHNYGVLVAVLEWVRSQASLLVFPLLPF